MSQLKGNHFICASMIDSYIPDMIVCNKWTKWKQNKQPQYVYIFLLHNLLLYYVYCIYYL